MCPVKFPVQNISQGVMSVKILNKQGKPSFLPLILKIQELDAFGRRVTDSVLFQHHELHFTIQSMHLNPMRSSPKVIPLQTPQRSEIKQLFELQLHRGKEIRALLNVSQSFNNGTHGTCCAQVVDGLGKLCMSILASAKLRIILRWSP